MPVTIEETLIAVAERQQARAWGKYRGIVTDNRDPLNTARVKVQVPAVLGEAEAWALPCLPYGGAAGQGLVTLPDVGATVWVEFEGGDKNFPLWVGAYWTAGALPAEATAPEVRLIRTASGHLLSFDDTSGAETVTLSHPKGASVTVDRQGTITLTDAGGGSVTLDAAGKLTLADSAGATATLEGGAVTLKDAAGATVEVSGGSITLKASATIRLDAPSVTLGGSGGEPVIKGSSFLSAYMAHTHPTGVGPSGPPIPTSEMGSLSAKVLTG